MKKGTQHDTASRLLIANSMKGKRNAVGNNGGRPERYQADYARQVYHVCLLGAVDTEIANFFDISVRTLNNWKKRYPDFMNGMWRGKTIADAEVANALYRSACGYDYVETTVWVLKNAKGERFIRTVEVIKHMPPNVKACMFWLTNRVPHLWSTKPVHLPAKSQNVYVQRDSASGEVIVEDQEAYNKQWVDGIEKYLAYQAGESHEPLGSKLGEASQVEECVDLSN